MPEITCKTCKSLHYPGSGGLSICYHCCLCDQVFVGIGGYSSADIYNRHYRSVHHCEAPLLPSSATYACVECHKDFYTERGFIDHLNEHKISDGYFKAIGRSQTTYRNTITGHTVHLCPGCQRQFSYKLNMKEHVKFCPSPSRYRCLNEGCLRTFGKIRDMVTHLESRGCRGKKKFSRESINRLICEKDTKGLITVPGALKLLDGHSERVKSHADTDSEPDTVIEAGLASPGLSDSSWGMLTPESKESDESYDFLTNRLENLDIISLNSNESEITPSMDSSVLISEPLQANQCRICYKAFRKEADLKQHLSSPVHAPKIYHCELSFLGVETQGPVKEFKTLSGLIGHIEAGACRGGSSTFDIAVSMLAKLAEGLGLADMMGLTKRIGGKFALSDLSA